MFDLGPFNGFRFHELLLFEFGEIRVRFGTVLNIVTTSPHFSRPRDKCARSADPAVGGPGLPESVCGWRGIACLPNRPRPRRRLVLDL